MTKTFSGKTVLMILSRYEESWVLSVSQKHNRRRVRTNDFPIIKLLGILPFVPRQLRDHAWLAIFKFVEQLVKAIQGNRLIWGSFQNHIEPAAGRFAKMQTVSSPIVKSERRAKGHLRR